MKLEKKEYQDFCEEVNKSEPIQNYLTKSKHGFFCCPECGSGTKSKGTGALQVFPKTNTGYCRACGTPFDLIKAYGYYNNLHFAQAVNALAKMHNIKNPLVEKKSEEEKAKLEEGLKIYIEDRRKRTMEENNQQEPTQEEINKKEQDVAIDWDGSKLPEGFFNENETENLEESAENEKKAPVDFKAYCIQAFENFAGSEGEDYVRGRGISSQTAKSYFIGYDAEADPINAPTGTERKLYPVKRVIIPVSKSHYIARRIDDIKDNKAPNPKGSICGVFNHKALETENNAKFICICEGVFDALSIIELGYYAIATNSANNLKPLLEILKSNDKFQYPPFVLCFDDDEAGTRASEKLKAELLSLNLKILNADIRGKYHDINERLQFDREGLKNALDLLAERNILKPYNDKDYLLFNRRADVIKYKNDVKTGFPFLDREIKGLYPGLYCLTGIPSLGKTTFATQIATQIATNHDVLFFSIEQGALEIVSKNLARQAFLNANKSTNCKISSLDIRLMEDLTPEIKKACGDYIKRIGDRLSTVEGNFQTTVTQIKAHILKHMKDNNVKPVIIIDYLQILKPDETKNYKSEKDAIDNIVTNLRILSREYQLPIIIISSMNRASYNTPITFQSLKESGGIEYTCDCILGLQLKIVTDPVFIKKTKQSQITEMLDKAKNEIPRKITLVGLKNRNGSATFKLDYLYYPLNEYFEEVGKCEISAPDDDDEDDDEQEAPRKPKPKKAPTQQAKKKKQAEILEDDEDNEDEEKSPVEGFKRVKHFK